METEHKRLFFGWEVKAPWPDSLPIGRVLKEEHRHLTLAFLGKTDYLKIKEALLSFPCPHFKLGFVGQFDQCIFLPPKHPHVVAWHIAFPNSEPLLAQCAQNIIDWLQNEGFTPDVRHPFYPHVTLARMPFNEKIWKKKFSPLPLFLKDLHLYESLGNSKYQSLWKYPLLPPFEEISHTADLAYWIRGKDYDALYLHAQFALAYAFPDLLPFLKKKSGIPHLDEVIIALNELVAHVDQEMNCPFKAVSFHSHIEEKDTILNWEMIIDV